jgi:hypothetical protein
VNGNVPQSIDNISSLLNALDKWTVKEERKKERKKETNKQTNKQTNKYRQTDRKKCMSFIHFVVCLMTGPLTLAMRGLKCCLFQFPVSSRFLKVIQ